MGNWCPQFHCHDVYVWLQINYFRWDNQSADPHGFHRFASLLINFRRLLQQDHVVGLIHWESIVAFSDVRLYVVRFISLLSCAARYWTNLMLEQTFAE